MDKITHKVRCEQWTNIIKECLASGMPKTTWCREHGMEITPEQFQMLMQGLSIVAKHPIKELKNPPKIM